MDIFSFYMPTRVFFGQGAVQKLARAPLAGRGLIITGGTSTTRLGYVAQVADALRSGGHETMVYDRVQPNPTIAGVRECAALCRENDLRFVVGVGGGSSIDTAKAAAIMATNDGDWWDYVAGGSGKAQKIPRDGLPVVAVPTTAGTGTETDPWTVITNGAEKIGGGTDRTFPAISVVDPALMASVPPQLTAFQGFDALFHACEGYIATCANPFSDMYALRAIELIGQSLARAVACGDDISARADVALASTLAGFVETLSSCTGEHALEHALSAYHPNLPHGAGLIALSRPYFSRFLEASCGRMIDMARALGMAQATAPEDFLTVLYNLQKLCGVDTLRLTDYGVDASDPSKYADNAQRTMGGLFRLDPRPLSREELIEILQQSCG